MRERKTVCNNRQTRVSHATHERNYGLRLPPRCPVSIVLPAHGISCTDNTVGISLKERCTEWPFVIISSLNAADSPLLARPRSHAMTAHPRALSEKNVRLLSGNRNLRSLYHRSLNIYAPCMRLARLCQGTRRDNRFDRARCCVHRDDRTSAACARKKYKGIIKKDLLENYEEIAGGTLLRNYRNIVVRIYRRISSNSRDCEIKPVCFVLISCFVSYLPAKTTAKILRYIAQELCNFVQTLDCSENAF